MIVVKIELWPGGNADRAEEIGRAALANISDLDRVSDYVAVAVDDKGTDALMLIEGHKRADGFWPLLARIFAAAPTAPKASSHWAQLGEAVKKAMFTR